MTGTEERERWIWFAIGAYAGFFVGMLSIVAFR